MNETVFLCIHPRSRMMLILKMMLKPIYALSISSQFLTCLYSAFFVLNVRLSGQTSGGFHVLKKRIEVLAGIAWKDKGGTINVQITGTI